MQQTIHTLEGIKAGEKPFTLYVTFAGEGQTVVDMTGVVFRLKPFSPLRNNETFRHVRVINHGGGIAWENGLDYSAEALHRLSEAQRGMTGAEFKAWAERLHLSNNEAGDVLGLSPRTVKAYKTRADTLPAAVSISCRVLERDPQELHAVFRPRYAGRPPKDALHIR